MRLVRAALAIGSAVATAQAAGGAAPAPPPPPAPPFAGNSAIVVQGIRDRDTEISNFIRGLTPSPQGGQLGRFESAVCPSVVGLTHDQNAFIADRIGRIAAAVGMPVGGAKCDPNVVLIIAGNKNVLVKWLARDRADYFPSDRNTYDMRALEDPHSPVAAWQIEGTRANDGKDLEKDMSGAAAGLYVNRTTEATTRMLPGARQYFAAAVVIVQADALAGLTITQLADYAAMRAFVRTDPKKLRSLGVDTILNVIDAPMGTPTPVTLTAWDLSFLKSYYESRLNNYASRQRTEMKGLMKRDLDQESRGNHD